MEWEIVESTAKELNKQNPEWRYGQSLFNALNMLDPEIAHKIRGTRNDCFHSDERIASFKLAVIELWKKDSNIEER